MSSFIRIWAVDGEVRFVHSSDMPLSIRIDEADPVEGASIYEGEIAGPYMDSGEVLPLIVLDSETFSVTGHEVTNIIVALTDVEKERLTMIVSPFQAKTALDLAGLLPQVETTIAAADTLTQRAWSEAIEFKRNSPTIVLLASALGLTDTQVDDLFRTAAGIEA